MVKRIIIAIIAAGGILSLSVVGSLAITNPLIVQGEWLVWLLVFIVAMNISLVIFDTSDEK